MSEQNGLPEGWVKTTLGEVATPTRVSVHPNEQPELPYIGLEHVEPDTMRLIGTSVAGGMKSNARLFDPGDVLYGRLRPYLNKVYRPNFQGLCSAEFIVLTTNASATDGKYLQYFLNSWPFVRFASHLNTGDRPRVDWDQLRSFSFHLPPLAEQRRIVAAIEEQISRLDAGVAALERARANLRRYRTAVLKAAVEGRLTEGWREENPDAEPASELLERILEERRERWEEDQLAAFEKKGKKPPENWREKYKEPVAPEAADLPELPEGWCWATVNQLNPTDHPCAYGILQPGPNVPDGVPLVRVGDVNDGRVNIEALKCVTSAVAERYPRTRLRGGEVLITLVGTIGRTAVVERALEGANTARAVGVVPLDGNILASWVEIWFRSPDKRREMITQAHEVARKTLNLKDVRAATVALPPRVEQEEIVAEVERRLSVLREVEAEVEADLKRAARLRQAVLKRAFEGKLVPQDPSDEPASELLARIRAEREREVPPKRRRKEPAREDGRGTQPSLFPSAGG